MDRVPKIDYSDATSEAIDFQWVDFLVPVELLRDSIQSPWGFRLRGGSDVDGGIPFEIIKVFAGGGSEGQLQVGDRVLGINNQNVELLSHFEAQHLFKSSGTRVKVHVLRSVKCDTNRMLRHVSNGGTPCFSGPSPPHSLQSASQQASTHLHLPSPKDLSFSKPHESETFKIIMREEIGSAKDQTGISARRFDKSGVGISHQGSSGRPESELSDSSDDCRSDPVLKNTSINQSTSFKKLMNAVTEF